MSKLSITIIYIETSNGQTINSLSAIVTTAGTPAIIIVKIIIITAHPVS